MTDSKENTSVVLLTPRDILVLLGAIGALCVAEVAGDLPVPEAFVNLTAWILHASGISCSVGASRGYPTVFTPFVELRFVVQCTFIGPIVFACTLASGGDLLRRAAASCIYAIVITGINELRLVAYVHLRGHNVPIVWAHDVPAKLFYFSIVFFMLFRYFAAHRATVAFASPAGAMPEHCPDMQDQQRSAV